MTSGGVVWDALPTLGLADDWSLPQPARVGEVIRRIELPTGPDMTSRTTAIVTSMAAFLVFITDCYNQRDFAVFGKK